MKQKRPFWKKIATIVTFCFAINSNVVWAQNSSENEINSKERDTIILSMKGQRATNLDEISKSTITINGTNDNGSGIYISGNKILTCYHLVRNEWVIHEGSYCDTHIKVARKI